MKKTEEKLVPTTVEVHVQSDRCTKIVMPATPEYDELFRLDRVGDYNSPFVDDNRVKCELCAECFYQLVGEYCRATECE